MKKFILLFLLLNSTLFSANAFLYKDTTIIEENITNATYIIIPVEVKEINFSTDIEIISRDITNIYPESFKSIIEEYNTISNELKNIKSEKKQKEKELENSKRKIDLLEKLIINLPITSNPKNPENAIEKFYQTFEKEMKEKDKISLQIEKLENEINEKEKKLDSLNKIINNNKISYSIIKFSKPFTGIYKYKIDFKWNIFYTLNKENNLLDMNCSFNYPKKLEIPVSKITLINYNYNPGLFDKFLYPSRLYLTGKMRPQRNVMAKSMSFELAAEKQEEKLVEIFESDVGFIFEINKNIKLNDKSNIPLITNLSIQTKSSYFAIPLKSSWGYNEIIISNTSNIPLLSGKINIYSKNETFELNITNTILQNSAYNLQGIEVKEISVERKLTEDYNDMPDLLRNTIINKKTIEIKIKNILNREIELSVFDRIPLPSEDRIKLKDIKITGKEDSEIKNILSKDGIIEWKINLKPKEEKKLYISYKTEYPKEYNIYEREE